MFQNVNKKHHKEFMANENRLCTLHIPRSVLTPQTELLTSSPISPNNQAYPLQETKKHLKMKIQNQTQRNVCSAQRENHQEKKYQNKNRKNVHVRYK